MARRFFFVSMGILCLTAAYQLGARSARADVDPTNPGPVLIADIGAWGADGSAWIAQSGGGSWYRQSTNLDLPVPASAVAMIDGESTQNFVLVTNSGAVWRCSGAGSVGSAWKLMPPFPGGPVPVEGSSFGQIKGQFRGGK